ncbi:hypothetical protein BKA67DRAFT_513199, partial [Truncatella angustata]
PDEVLESLTETYQRKIHFQPLPLFNIRTLNFHIKAFPQFLLFSFLSLVLRYTKTSYFQGREEDAIDFYRARAQDTTLALASQGVDNCNVSRALCLLALSDMLGSNLTQCWMTIGMAARLGTLRRHVGQKGTAQWRHLPETEERCHAYWSVLILENAFGPPTNPPTDFLSPLPCPEMHRLPSVKVPSSAHGNSPDIGGNTPTEECDINSFCVEVISIWTEIAGHIQSLRLGKLEQPWQPCSDHTRLFSKIHDFETRLPSKYLLRHVKFQDRSVQEVKSDWEYWISWVLLQFSLHSACALLSHPFIHVFVLRDNRRASPPRLFLQQMLDQAIYHSGWIAQLLEACEAVEMEIRNPLIGQMIVTAASILWLLRFSRDAGISENARRGFCKCEEVLSSLNPRWHHLEKKV